MADASFVQSSFLGGEISKLIQGRVDRPEYRTSMNVCINGLPIETGGWVRRPGFMFAQTTRGGAAGRNIKFDFDETSPYEMEFTDGHLRFRSGLTLVTTNEATGVVTVSAANPAVAQIDGPVSWDTGDQAYFTGLGQQAPTLQNRTVSLVKIDSSNFSLHDAVTGAAIDGATIGAVTGGTISKVLDIATPYAGGIWSALRSVQTEEVAFFLTPTVKPYALHVTQPVGTDRFASFALAAAIFLDGPYFDVDTSGVLMTPTGGTVVGANVTGSVTLTASGTSSSFPGFASTDVGRMVRLLSEPPEWVSGTAYHLSDAIKSAGAYYGCIADVTSTTPPANDPSHWGIAPQNSRWAWGAITHVASPTVCTVLLGGKSFLLSWQNGGMQPVATWRLGLYSDTTGYPTCGTYHEGRVWLSGAVKNRIDGCVANSIAATPGTVNFAPTGNGLGEDDVTTTGAVFGNSAISYVFNSPDANPILWMTPDLQGIICGTKAGEWLVIAPTSGGLTALNIAARRVTKIGCANVEPVHTEHTTVFVQKFGRKVMEYFADVFSGKFTAPHLTFTAKHLTKGDIQELAYQQELAPIVWARVNGNLRGCTYKRETLMTSQGPTAAGWHQHPLGSGRVVESISAGPSVGGTTDALTIVTNDPATNVRHVEVMTDILDEGATLAEASYLDDAAVPTSTRDAPAGAGMPYGGLTLNGLWHLNGKTVTAWLGGLDCGDYTVANGSITVPYGDSISAGSGTGLFTPEFIASFNGAMPMVVGFSYFSDGQIVRPNSREESGARNGPALGKKRRNQQFAVLLEGTQGISFGTDFNHLDPAEFRYDNDTRYPVNVQFSGVFRDNITDDYGYDGMVCWRLTRPYIGNIAAISPFLSTQDA